MSTWVALYVDIGDESIMWRYFCLGFFDFMLAGKALTEFENLFLSNKFKKNDDIILKCFINNI